MMAIIILLSIYKLSFLQIPVGLSNRIRIIFLIRLLVSTFVSYSNFIKTCNQEVSMSVDRS
jgi:hypothetical protein